MIITINPELELLFRQYFAYKKNEIYYNLSKSTDNLFYEKIDNNFKLYFGNAENDNSVFKARSIKIKIRDKIQVCDIYYKKLYLLIDQLERDNYIFDDINLENIMDNEFGFNFLKIFEKIIKLWVENDNYIELGGYYSMADWRNYYLLYICDFYLKKHNLEFYNNEFRSFLKNKSNHESDFFLFSCKMYLKNILHINFKSKLERKVAHYTNVNVVEKIINKKSKFRINCTNLMNDPREGKELFTYLNKIVISDRELNSSNIYLGCFTFNHNSLNQFRLYGRTRSIECSGVSLVFNSKFFANKINDNKLDRLYRCVYIEPNSGFIQIACRDKFTFIQEAGEYSLKVEQSWILYERMINIKNKYLRILIDLMKYVSSKYSIKEEVLILILGETRFLFKNFCFKDEQECRIIKNVNILDVNNNGCVSSYIDYNGNIYSSLTNVYIGEASIKISRFIQKMILSKKNFSVQPKIKISEHPFRASEYLDKLN